MLLDQVRRTFAIGVVLTRVLSWQAEGSVRASGWSIFHIFYRRLEHAHAGAIRSSATHRAAAAVDGPPGLVRPETDRYEPHPVPRALGKSWPVRYVYLLWRFLARVFSYSSALIPDFALSKVLLRGW